MQVMSVITNQEEYSHSKRGGKGWWGGDEKMMDTAV